MDVIQALIGISSLIIVIAMGTFFCILGILGKDIGEVYNKIHNLEKKIDELLNKK